MAWRDAWPVAEGDQDPGYEYLPTGPFRVAIKDSACRADPELSELREEQGEIIEFESNLEAKRTLIEGRGLEGLGFQKPAPQDPQDVDAYLVLLPDSDPDPEERGPAEEGWRFRMSANQVGALSEALFDAQPSNPPPIVAYACRDLSLEADEIRVEVNRAPEAVGKLEFYGGDGRWLPDFEFVVRRVPDGSSSGRGGPVLKRYIAEVKHGSASFERHQRERMRELAEEAGEDTDVLVIRVELIGAPQEYGVRIRRLI